MLLTTKQAEGAIWVVVLALVVGLAFAADLTIKKVGREVMRVPEGKLVILTEAPPSHKPVRVQVTTDKGRVVVAEIDDTEFEAAIDQWQALRDLKRPK